MNYNIIVLSCDKYSACWKPFFALLDKYWKNHPKTYLVTETKQCEYSNTINISSDCWTERFRKALEQIDTDYVIVMLDDFFIRRKVDTKRIDYCLSQMNDDIAVFNFEKKYRQCDESNLIGFERQLNNQVYLTSTQPSIWNKRALIELLQKDMNPWEFETQVIKSNKLFYINTEDYIIDIGYRHQPLSIGWGITRNAITKECLEFLKSENIDTTELESRFDIL